ncbi:hypothetical protein [Flammeovirga sp. EKP202]|uniref:hypothetical protein n=1 Tax=Flammeovirga sp. EKP202 TaxID=2770592 RepID=UPI00165EFFA8|nr:hypothetical protein [Flammeovirga sp. EKP202]MBD0403901.1 hypothetical protein [Flammeovirga sp. EKP202]
MKHLIRILLIIGLISCEESKPRLEAIENEDLTTEQIDSILAEFKFDYESPIIIDFSNQIMIPISTELLGRRTKYSKDGYYSDDYPRYWNIQFYNRKTGETRLLTEDKIRISRIHVNRDNEYEEGCKVMKEKILYEIGDIDFNNDGKLDGEDPEYLFISENNGTNLKRISPRDEELQYFEVVPKSNQILIRTLRDINQDSIFNQQDESIWYKAELTNQEWKLNEIIDSTGRKKIENLYFDQWLKKKLKNNEAEH